MNMDYQDLQEYVEERTGRSSNGGAIAGFLIGAGVGILAGILLAPRAGRDTIKQVSDRTGDWKNQLSDLINKAGSVASDYLDKGKDVASKASSRVQNSVS